jgi:hypothetical protein
VSLECNGQGSQRAEYQCPLVAACRAWDTGAGAWGPGDCVTEHVDVSLGRVHCLCSGAARDFSLEVFASRRLQELHTSTAAEEEAPQAPAQPQVRGPQPAASATRVLGRGCA